MHGPLLALLALAVSASASRVPLAEAERLVGALFPGGPGDALGSRNAAAFSHRLSLGRVAQLGPDMVYRPGMLGGDVDTALTYGEYNLDFFARLVDVALGGASLPGYAADDGTPVAGKAFVDVGSGCGRLVFAASYLWPQLRSCVGIEKVRSLHELAVKAEAAGTPEMEAAPRTFLLGDANELLGTIDADVAFAYCSTWPSIGDELTTFSSMCGRHLRRGSRVVTTDRKLADDADGEYSFRLLEAFDGTNAETGGTSTGYVWEVA